MRIFNKDKTTELFDIDKTKGRLLSDVLITHHDAIPSTSGQFHYEVVKEYPNGGKDVMQIWDEAPVVGKDAWDEREAIQIFIPFTEEELLTQEHDKKVDAITKKIQLYQDLLKSWDYKTSKHADGEYTEEEWTEIVAQRKKWRAEINRLEIELQQLS